MKLLALIEAPDHVCYRYRLAAFASAFAQRNWHLESLPLASGTMARTAQLNEAVTADVVVLQRRLLPFWQLRILRKAAKVLVYDFDDALFHRDWQASKGPISWQRLAHFWATVYASDAVIAGNHYLRDQAVQYVDPAKVHLVPTCIDPQLYPIAEHVRQGGQAKLVWIGQRSTLPSLHYGEVALGAAGKLLPGLEIRVICDQFPILKGVQVIPRAWSEATEGQEVADADIGVSWLPDHPWSLGKCALKVLQYMAAGLPVVANPIGIHHRLVKHGETGFLASTPNEWAYSVKQLADDPQLRTRMGQAARRFVTRELSVNRWAPELAGLIDRFHLQSPSTPLSESRLDAAWMMRGQALSNAGLTKAMPKDDFDDLNPLSYE